MVWGLVLEDVGFRMWGLGLGFEALWCAASGLQSPLSRYNRG